MYKKATSAIILCRANVTPVYAASRKTLMFIITLQNISTFRDYVLHKQTFSNTKFVDFLNL